MDAGNIDLYGVAAIISSLTSFGAMITSLIVAVKQNKGQKRAIEAVETASAQRAKIADSVNGKAEKYTALVEDKAIKDGIQIGLGIKSAVDMKVDAKKQNAEDE